MNNKLIIVNWESSNQGKTESIKEVWNILQLEYNDELNVIYKNLQFGNSKDIMVVVDFRGVRLGICSYGDAGQYYRTTEILNKFLDENCQIMVLASRTRGRTVDEINKLESLGWEIRWEQNEHPTDSNEFDRCNKEFVQKVVDIIIKKVDEIKENK